MSVRPCSVLSRAKTSADCNITAFRSLVKLTIREVALAQA